VQNGPAINVLTRTAGPHANASACANRELMTEFRRKVAPRRNERARIASPIGILAPHRAG
jgi:hypothetical protein